MSNYKHTPHLTTTPIYSMIDLDQSKNQSNKAKTQILVAKYGREKEEN